jgi:cytoskeletal protein RodZ
LETNDMTDDQATEPTSEQREPEQHKPEKRRLGLVPKIILWTLVLGFGYLYWDELNQQREVRGTPPAPTAAVPTEPATPAPVPAGAGDRATAAAAAPGPADAATATGVATAGAAKTEAPTAADPRAADAGGKAPTGAAAGMPTAGAPQPAAADTATSAAATPPTGGAAGEERPARAPSATAAAAPGSETAADSRAPMNPRERQRRFMAEQARLMAEYRRRQREAFEAAGGRSAPAYPGVGYPGFGYPPAARPGWSPSYPGYPGGYPRPYGQQRPAADQ